MRCPSSVLFIAASAAFFLAACGGGGSGGSAKELSRWTANYQPKQGQTSKIEAGPAFDYPTSSSRQINTLANGFRGNATANGGVAVTFELVGEVDTQFRHDAGGTGKDAVRVVVFVQRCGDNYRDDNGRWWWPGWVELGKVLNKGPITIEAPFSGEWTNVQGKKGKPDVGRICNAGLAFGGGFAHTHGNWATGPARFTVSRFEVN